MTKAYVRLDKIKPSAHIESVVSEAVLPNGQWVKFGALDEDLGGEAIKATKAVKGEKPEGLVTTVHVDYGHPDYNILDQVTKIGKVGRTHIVEEGNRFAFLKDMATGVAIGDEVTVGEDGFGVAKAEVGNYVVGTAIGEDYLANIGDLVIVRIGAGKVAE